MLKARLGSKCPKIIRVYSEVLENQVFPIPRDSMQIGSQKGRRYELITKDENKDIALHHLIRDYGKKFSARIKEFDRIFYDIRQRDCPEEISDEKIEEYQKLVTDAVVHELQSYDVILCTCATSASPRMKRGVNIRQIIIDECGMCMEPESLIPLVTFKAAEQVVLIGDHKQLQPIVLNTVASDLGLKVSLFERYKDRAIMLTEQYRMVILFGLYQLCEHFNLISKSLLLHSGHFYFSHVKLLLLKQLKSIRIFVLICETLFVLIISKI